jgi:hypothetical protein
VSVQAVETHILQTHPSLHRNIHNSPDPAPLLPCRTWIIIAIRTLLATRHLASIFAYAPIAAFEIARACSDWTSIAENARAWQASCANPEMGPPLISALVAAVPASMRGGVADVAAGVFLSIAMVSCLALYDYIDSSTFRV